jgi:hypothetical protein
MAIVLIILVAINGYSIGGYCGYFKLNYHRLLVVIILMVIDG